MEKNKASVSGLFILKHKDLDVAMVKIDPFSGFIEYVLEVYLPEELPVGCSSDTHSLENWWKLRAIPDHRKGIQQVLHYLNESTSQSLMLSAYGLSLTDHYWMQPLGQEIYWKNINFYENEFSDTLGDLLTDSQKIDLNSNISKFSPSSSVTGEMKKKWVLVDGKRYLMKISTNCYGQQSVNEFIATKLYEASEWKNYVPYRLDKIKQENAVFPCSLNQMFTSVDIEFVSAYQLLANYKIPNETSVYEALIHQATTYGLPEQKIRMQLEYMILTDFLLTNTDRHFNNLGFLYNAEQQRFIAMAPLFDAGNSLFFDCDVIPLQSGLLDISVNSFCKRETDMLKYITTPSILDLKKLRNFPQKVEEILKEETRMPKERAEKIALTVKRKLNYLQLFYEGTKIWKPERYW